MVQQKSFSYLDFHDSKTLLIKNQEHLKLDNTTADMFKTFEEVALNQIDGTKNAWVAGTFYRETMHTFLGGGEPTRTVEDEMRFSCNLSWTKL